VIRLTVTLPNRGRTPSVFLIEVREDGTPELRAEGAALLSAAPSASISVRDGVITLDVEAEIAPSPAAVQSRLREQPVPEPPRARRRTSKRRR